MAAVAARCDMADRFRFRYNYGAVLFYFALFLGMLLMNFTMDAFEPFSLALYAAAMACGLHPLVMTALYLLAGGLSLAAVPIAMAIFALQGAFLGTAFMICRIKKRAMRAEMALFFALAQAPFIGLYGEYIGGYLRAAIVAVTVFALCFVCFGALRFALLRAGKCLPLPEELVFCGAAAAAVGIGLYNCAGTYVYGALALLSLLLCCALIRSGNAVFCAFVLAIPPAICESVAAAAPALVAPAAYILYAALALAFLRAGKFPAALAVFFAAVAVLYFTHFYRADDPAAAFAGAEFYGALASVFLPCLLFALLPERATDALSRKLRRFGDKPLTRASMDRDRARTGEKLFELSAAMRDVECAVRAFDDGEQESGALLGFLREEVERNACAACEKREECRKSGNAAELDKLVAVGMSKGKVNLIDLPSALAGGCADPAGVLFSLNKLLAEYRRRAADEESAAKGRTLLARIAEALSLRLKDMALEQSVPVGVYAAKEKALRTALGKSGIACGEILVCGQDPQIYLTLSARADEQTARSAVEEAFGFSAVLAAKRAVSAERMCLVYRRKPKFDAAFGVASRTRDGEDACGDTHSVIKIDERTFLCALSDGMGSGSAARRISDRALGLLESFYRAGMRGDCALGAVNGLLGAAREENFACIDAATVDLDSGRADIVKIGSPLGFLLTPSQTEILESDSLPLGILDEVHPTVLTRTLGDGDVLLFLSDGITAAFGSSTDIAEFLSGAHLSNPQTLADSLLDAALRAAGGTAGDDMTAVAVRLFKAA